MVEQAFGVILLILVKMSIIDGLHTFGTMKVYIHDSIHFDGLDVFYKNTLFFPVNDALRLL